MKLKDHSTEPEGFNINSRRCNLWKEWEISIIGFGGMLGSAVGVSYVTAWGII